MNKVLLLLSTLVCLSQILPSASAQQAKPKSFAAWCQQKKSVPTDTRHTIDILLKKAGTNNCEIACL